MSFLFILSYWLSNYEKELDGSLSDCFLGFGCKTTHGDQEYCDLFKNFFSLRRNLRWALSFAFLIKSSCSLRTGMQPHPRLGPESSAQTDL